MLPQVIMSNQMMNLMVLDHEDPTIKGGKRASHEKQTTRVVVGGGFGGSRNRYTSQTKKQTDSFESFKIIKHVIEPKLTINRSMVSVGGSARSMSIHAEETNISPKMRKKKTKSRLQIHDS
jgi:hypothetical protein